MTDKTLIPAFGEIDADTMKLHRAGIEAAITDYCSKNRLSFMSRPGSYDKLGFTFELEFGLVTKDEAGNVVPHDEAVWNAYAEKFGLKPEWLRKECVIQGHRFTIVGLDKKTKKVIALLNEDSSRHRLDKGAVIGHMKMLEESATLGETATRPKAAAAPTAGPSVVSRKIDDDNFVPEW